MRSEVPRDFNEAQHPWFYSLVYGGVRSAIAIFRDIHVVGLENLPTEGKCVIAPNHRSFWDPLYMGVTAPRPVRSMAKKELWSKPYFFRVGYLAGLVGGFPVDRNNPGSIPIRIGIKALAEDDHALMVFPESTSKIKGRAIGKLHDGAAHMAIHASSEEKPCPLVPVGIASEDLAKSETVQIVIDPPIYPEAYTATKANRNNLTDQLADALQKTYNRALDARESAASQ